MEKGIVIVDLDGTLADGTQRLHLLPAADKRDKTWHWDEFNRAACYDSPIQDTIDIVNALHNKYFIIILTGRCDVVKEETLCWLDKHLVSYDKIIMRKASDHRQDIDIKEEELRKLGLENILACFDDLPHVVEHIRSLGLTCYHVDRANDKYAATNKGAGK